LHFLEVDKSPKVHEKDKINMDFANGIDTRWQTVEGTKNHAFLIYSAYYDIRDSENPIVRVIGVTRTNKTEKVRCRLYFDDSEIELIPFDNRIKNSTRQTNRQSFHDVSADISIIWGHHYKTYSACFVLCPVPFQNSKGRLIPVSVSILPFSDFENVEVTNRLRVINSKNGGTGTYQVNKTDIGVCVKPIRACYNRTLEIIEFIELNKILGVSKFTVYNQSMSEEVSCVLNYYMNQEHSVYVLAWDLMNADSKLHIHDTGGLAARNDCVYRNMNEFHYLMMVDLDEFIIPHVNTSLQDMLKYLNSKYFGVRNVQKSTHQKLISSYNFKNGFFYLQFGNNLISI
jgi:hypothetical protein